MNRKTSFVFLFFVCFGLVFSSCSSGTVDCSSQDTTYKKYGWSEEFKQCVLINDIQPNICGNGIPESGEDYCSCPSDDGGDILKTDPVRGCSGGIGEYLEKTCNINDECVMQQSNKVVSQIKSLEFKNSDIIFRGDFTLNTPFIQNVEDENKIKAELELFKFVSSSSSVSITNVVLKEMTVENTGGIKFAAIDYNEGAINSGQNFKTKEFGLNEVNRYQARESLRINLVVSYTKESFNSVGESIKVEDKIETLSASLGYWDIVNPNFYEEDE